MTDVGHLSRVILGCAGVTLTADERAFFADTQPFGFILFARNIENPKQLSELTESLRASVGWHAPIFIDQEGGRVARMVGHGWHEMPPALEHMGHIDVERVFWLRGCLIAHDLKRAGIDVNCAPLGDVANAHTHPVLKNRCYGMTVPSVVAAAKSLIAGQAAGGVASVLKHIPGHGRAVSDSHKQLPKVSASRQELDETDFKAFQQLRDTPMGMTAHIVFEDIDPNLPATQSTTMMDVIRDDIGFDNLLMTDDLSMQALSGDMPTRLMAALAAGCDLGLHCNGDMNEMRQIAQVVPRFDGPSAVRAIRALSARPDEVAVDINALKAEFTGLLNRTA